MQGSRRTTDYAVRAAIIVAAVALAGTIAIWAWGRFGPHPNRSVAVMPLANRTGDPRLDYLGEGIAADLVSDLVRGAGLNVASLSSAIGLKTMDRRASSVAHELGVHAVLDGSLRTEGSVTFVDIELVDGASQLVMWTNRYACTLENVRDIERDVVRQVASRLTGRPAREGPENRGTAARSPSAYSLYQQAGTLLRDTDDPQRPDRALGLFQRAIDLDPEFALAWAGRSSALWKIWMRDNTPESLHLAEEAANRAVRLNPQLLEARLARAQIYRGTSRYDDSVRELRAVLAVNPNWDEAEVQLAATYRDAGHLDSAEVRLRRAVSLRPDYWRNWNSLGALLVKRGNYPGARMAFQQITRLVPEKNRGYEQLAALETLQGNSAAAITAYEKLPAPVQDGTLASNIGTAYFFQNRLPEAERFYRLAVSLEPRNPTWRENLGDLHVRARAPDSARVEFRAAVGLIEDMLHVNPQDAMLGLERAVCLAKAGDCAGGQAAFAALAPRLSTTTDADCAHRVAKLEALCGQRAKLMEALERAIKLGISPQVVRNEDEFRAYASDARFLALTSPGKR